MRVKHIVKYYRHDYGPDDVLDCETSWAEEFPHRIAEDCAEDYHSNHDGWECSWPIKFVVLAEDGSALGTFEVDRESVPQFSATPVPTAREWLQAQDWHRSHDYYKSVSEEDVVKLLIAYAAHERAAADANGSAWEAAEARVAELERQLAEAKELQKLVERDSAQAEEAKEVFQHERDEYYDQWRAAEARATELSEALRAIVQRWQQMDREQDGEITALRRKYWGDVQDQAEAALAPRTTEEPPTTPAEPGTLPR